MLNIITADDALEFLAVFCKIFQLIMFHNAPAKFCCLDMVECIYVLFAYATYSHMSFPSIVDTFVYLIWILAYTTFSRKKLCEMN